MDRGEIEEATTRLLDILVEEGKLVDATGSSRSVEDQRAHCHIVLDSHRVCMLSFESFVVCCHVDRRDEKPLNFRLDGFESARKLTAIHRRRVGVSVDWF